MKEKTIVDAIENLGKPPVFLLAVILPQVILFGVHFYHYSLISGELTEKNIAAVIIIFIAEIALFLFFAGSFLLVKLKKGNLSWLLALVYLAAGTGYMILFFNKIYSAIPWSISRWILNRDILDLYESACMMPPLFYSLLYLSSIKLHLSKRKDVIISLTAAVIPAGAWFTLFQIKGYWKFIHHKVVEVLLPYLIIIFTIVMILAVMRLFIFLYTWAKDKKLFLPMMSILFGLIMPLAVLFFNREYHFPVDLQSLTLYIIVIINGVVISLPEFKNQRIDFASAIIRFTMFPFTLYFFLLFLPFLPLAFIAIAALGVGFLILSPSLLFMLHIRRLHSDYNNHKGIFTKKIEKGLLLGALFVLPLLFVLQAVTDRISLNQAVSYVYEGDYRVERFTGSEFFVKNSLENCMRKEKNLQLPLLSGIYNWITFDNLHLPESKIKKMYNMFFGDYTEAIKRINSRRNFISSGRSLWQGDPQKKFTESTTVTINSMSYETKNNGDTSKTMVKLELKNHGSWDEEFRTNIHLQEGTFISGYWLTIGKKRVPGRIYEKKTALWVYRMIKKTRRDPGLLYYDRLNSLHLHVFPFSREERRVTEIEFIHPAALDTTITIGNKKIFIKGSRSAMAHVSSAKSEAYIISAKDLVDVSPVMRKPYYHFIVDWSSTSTLSFVTVMERINEIMYTDRGVEYCSITFVNYESENVSQGIISEDKLKGIITLRYLKKRGGFARDRALKQVLLRYRSDTSASLEKPSIYYPVIIVMADPATPVIQEGRFSYFRKLLPDVEGYYTMKGKKRSVLTFAGDEIGELHPEPVFLFGREGNYRPVKAHGTSVVHFDREKDAEPFHFIKKTGRNMVYSKKVEEITDISYRSAMEGDFLFQRNVLYPFESGELLNRSVALAKKSGILNGSASYIVVEQDSHWKMLELKEKNKLRNAQALELTRSPEPGYLLVIFFLAYLVFSRRRNGWHKN